MGVDDEQAEGQGGGGGPEAPKSPNNMPQGAEGSLPQDSSGSQSPSYSSLPSLQGSTPTVSPPGSPLSDPGGGTIGRSGSLSRVEGRRGRNWWEWKAAEEQRTMMMQSGDEGDDELSVNTSIDSDSLRRRGQILPKIHENLPVGGGARGGSGVTLGSSVVAGVVAAGGGGGGGAGGGRGPGDVWVPSDGGGGAGSVGPRVAWGERASQQPGHPPTLLQQQHQKHQLQQARQQNVLQYQQSYVPNQPQPQHYHLPPRRAAPPPTHGRTGANPTRPGAIASLGLGTSYITSAAPPSVVAQRSQELPKKVTVKSYNQARLTPSVSGTTTPSDSSPSTPTYDRRQLGDGNSSASPSVERRPEPTAPPIEELYAEASKKLTNRGYTEVYNSNKPGYKKQPHEYPGAQRVLPDLQGSYQFSQPPADTSVKQTITTNSAQQTPTVEVQAIYKESNSAFQNLESVPYSPLRRYPSKDSFTQTPLYQEIDDSPPEIHNFRGPANQRAAPKDSYSSPQDTQSRPREVSPPLREAAPAGAQGPPRRPSISSSGYSTTQETEVSGAWVEQAGGGAKFVPTIVKKKDPAKPAGSLVWVNQPGGGAKLEFLPAPRASSVTRLSVSPQPLAGHQRQPPSSPSLQQRQPPSSPSLQRPQGAAASDISNRVVDPGSPPVAAGQWDGDGGGGGGGGPGLVVEERVTRASASAMPRAGGVGNGTTPSRDHGSVTITTGTPQKSSLRAQPIHEYAQNNTQYTQPKNLYSSAPGDTDRPAGRTSEDDEDEGSVLTVAGRTKGQTVRIRVRPDVHAYLTGQPTAYITAALAAAAASGGGRRDSDAQGSSSGSALTAGSEGEGSIGYHENDYEEVVDEYTLLRRAVDDHDPEAMQLLVQAEQALYPDIPARPGDPGRKENGKEHRREEEERKIKREEKEKRKEGKAGCSTM